MNKVMLTMFVVSSLIFAGCSSQIDIDTAIKLLPQVQKHLEENPNADLQVAYYSLEEISTLESEFKVNCGKDIPQKALYRFKVDSGDGRLSGVGYFDMNEQILECFKKTNELSSNEIVQNNEENYSVSKEEVIVVDDVVVNSNGVVVSNNVEVSNDGSIVAGGVQIGNDGSVYVNTDSNTAVENGIVVTSSGDVITPGAVVKADGSVTVGNINVGSNGEVIINGEEVLLSEFENSMNNLEETLNNTFNELEETFDNIETNINTITEDTQQTITNVVNSTTADINVNTQIDIGGSIDSSIIG